MPETPDSIAAIITQLGGARIFAMAFSHATYDGSDATPAVTLHVPKTLKARDRVRWVRITLEPSDTYRVEFLANSKSKGPHAVRDRELVHADQLRQVVEHGTGLALAI